MALEEAGVKLIAAGANVYIVDLKSAESATNGFVDATEKGGGRVNAAGQVMIGALRQVGVIAVEAFLAAGKAAASFIGDSIGLAGDFEASMLEFQSVAGRDVDASGLEDFRDLFLDIGKRLPVSTSEVQQAAIEMVKGGIDPATIAAGGLEQNIQFAAAAMGGDLVKAAEISSKIMGGWTAITDSAADKSSFLTHATDLLAKAANASSTDVEGLSLGIFNAQGIAKTAGVSFDDLTTTLAALAPRFESSSVAGNSLKNMIARLQPTTDPAAQAMQALGLYTEETGSAFYDAQGNFVGFEQAAQLLKESLTGLTKEQQAATLQQIFGNDAMGAAAALAELGAAGYQGMAEALANANGVAEAAALKQQGFNTALENAKGSVEALQITIGSALLPVLADLLNNVVAPAVNAFTDWADSILSAEDPIQELVNQIDTFSPALGTVVAAIADFITSGGDLGVVADDLNEGMAGLGDAFLAVVDVANTVSGAVDDLSGIWNKAIGVVEDVANGYKDIIDSVLPIVTSFVDEHGTEISAFFKTTYDTIIRVVGLALDLYDAVVPKVLGSVAKFIDDHATGIEAAIGGAWNIISGVITGALALIEGVIKTALALIEGDWEGAWGAIQEMSVKFVESLGQVIEGGLNIIAGLFDTNLKEIGDLWRNNWDMFVGIVTKIADRMPELGRSIVQGIQRGLENAWDSLVGWVTDKISNLFDQAMETAGAGSPAKEWMPLGVSMTQGIMAGFSEMWPALTKLVDSLGQDLIDQAADIGRSVQGAIASSFGATASIDRQIASNLDRFEDVPKQYAQFTEGALKDAEHAARQFLDPTEGAQFFKMRSDQILEFAELQQQLAETQDSEERKRIQNKMNLINAAQTAEINAFNANLGAGLSGTESLMDQIAAFMRSKTKNAKGEDVDVFPGILENETVRAFNSWLTQMTNYAPNPYRNPMMSGATTYNQQRQYTMPVYTNNSPEALQQSLALAGAMYP